MNPKIGIVGLGYVGLPLSVLFAEAGFEVIGYDRDVEKIRCLWEGIVYIDDISTERFLACASNITPTLEPKDLSGADFIAVCVPTPISKNKTPDTQLVESAVDAIKPYVRKGAVVSIESTVYPNFTKDVIAPRLPEAHVVFSPERVDPSNSKFDLKDVPKVLGADTETAMSRARDVYSKVFTLVEVSSTSTAEAAKLLENTYRAVNIALANEMARLCGTLDINVWEVIQAAATKPFGFQAFYPSLGVGGHCIPVDPYYLLHKGESELIRKSLEINSAMTHKCTERIAPSCSSSLLAHKPILFLGVAYKPDVSDTRESPALEVLRSVASAVDRGGSSSETYRAYVNYYDPHVPSIQVPSVDDDAPYTMYSLRDVEEAIENAGIIVICVKHTRFERLKARILAKVNQKLASENGLSEASSSSNLHELSCEVFDFCGMFEGDSRISGL
jgi:UDP-N-acetyl-D-glucosamine dehydrogenase